MFRKSAAQLLDGRFVDRVMELLREHRLPARCIEIELTENVLQTGVATIEVLRQLRAHGVAVALDDFGTGYSSLASLEQLPTTRVKLDRGRLPCDMGIFKCGLGSSRKYDHGLAWVGVGSRAN